MNHAQRLALWRDTLTPGRRIRCVENTRIPTRAGVIVEILTVGVYYATACCVSDPSGQLVEGATFHLDLPKLARNLHHATADRIRYTLEGPRGGECEWEVID